jgi:hypothetical protein
VNQNTERLLDYGLTHKTQKNQSQIKLWSFGSFSTFLNLQILENSGLQALKMNFLKENLANIMLVKFAKCKYTIKICMYVAAFFQNFPKFAHFKAIFVNQKNERLLDCACFNAQNPEKPITSKL